MRVSLINRAVLRSVKWVGKLLADKRGSSDLTVHLLLTAAGAAMVAITVPTLFSSSKSAANTFQNQVTVLEQGANPSGNTGGSGSGSGSGGSGWSFHIGSGGISGSTPWGSFGVGSKGGSVSGGGSGVAATGNAAMNSGASGGGAALANGGANATTNSGAGPALTGGGRKIKKRYYVRKKWKKSIKNM